MPNTIAGPSANLQSQLRDKAKHTATLIQEITDELQAIEEESPKEDQDSDATQESDLEQEDSDITLPKMSNDYVKNKKPLSVIINQIIRLKNITKVTSLNQ